ncbi:hypothetical protein Bca52824_044462 [Brassica carinata]|uniref:Uncharacterized protein n=1 Tax=Brassica carinata TaxID=52824 RepID=A0A8X7R8S5_BRACI|nr:hypothetical protein Bca52824_044462 [Brassica carinata]
MEVESQNNRDSCSAQRFGLKNSIPTNFGSDYVFQIVPKVDWTAMAVSLSTNSVKLYSPLTAQYYGEFKGHSDTINQIAFSSESPHLLHSCSSDGTIRSWDTRSFHQVACIDADNDQEVLASPLEVLEIIFSLLDAKNRFVFGTGETLSKLLVYRNPIWTTSLRCLFLL